MSSPKTWSIAALMSSTALGADFGPLERSITSGAHGEIVAVVVEQGGSVLYHRQFRDGVLRRGSTGDPDLHDIRSAGKSLTALAVGLAISEGLLSLDTPVWPLLGESRADASGILVEDLLTMSSALDCDDGDRRSRGFEERMYRRRSWRRFALGLPLDDQWQRAPHGRGRFSYCTAGVFLLGQVVETVTHQPMDAYLRARVFDPLGMGPIQWRRSRSGELQTGGQIEVTARDITRIGRLVLDGGRHNDVSLIDEGWIDAMLTPRVSLGRGNYGYLWWSHTFAAGSPATGWYMSGNGGNIVAVFEDHDLVVTVQSANYNQPGAHEGSFDLIEQALVAVERSASR